MQEVKSKLHQMLLAMSEINHRLSKIESDVRMVLESESERRRYIQAATETMRNAAKPQ